MRQYDSVVIGAGHNGLVCAAYLARAGQSVLVLDAADGPGGLAASREFHPGFRTSIAHSIGHFSGVVAKDLGLDSHGYSSASLPLVGLGNGGPVVVEQNSLHGGSESDSAAYERYYRLMRRCADALDPFWLKTMPRVGGTSLSDLMTFGHVGLNLRRMGRQDMQEFLRIASLPARDLMDEFFDDELVKATLCWDGLIGAKMAPRSPNSAVLAMLYRMSGGGNVVSSGHVQSLVDALAASATAAGAELRYASHVDRILVEQDGDGLAAVGVQLAGGDKITARRIISSADPRRTFAKLVGVQHLDIEFTNRIRRLRCDGYVGKMHLALSDLPEFTGLERPNGRMVIAPTMDSIEFAFDDAKYGACSKSPVVEVVVPSVHDATLAPEGRHVLSAHVMFVPYQRKGGWTDEARDEICDRSIDVIQEFAPKLREMIVHQEFLTPLDLEREYRVTGGHWHHADFAIDQLLMMRPTYGAAQYNTPLPGLYLCGAGSHPGGDLVGAAGHNAAREILR